jgi:hypothetical protein
MEQLRAVWFKDCPLPCLVYPPFEVNKVAAHVDVVPFGTAFIRRASNNPDETLSQNRKSLSGI